MKKYLPTIIVGAAVAIIIGFVIWAASSPKNDGSQQSTQSTETDQDSSAATEEQQKALKTGWSRGNDQAKVVVTEFGDFQCPACARISPQINEQLLPKYGDKILFVFKNFPLEMHKNSWPAAQAAEAAGAQGQYWPMHDLIYEKQNEWSESASPNDKFIAYAQELGLNVDKFRSDIEAKRFKDRIQADLDLGKSLNIPGTPSFYVNGQPVDLQSGIKDIESAIDKALGQ